MSPWFFLNTNNADTRILFAHGSHYVFFWTRITRITRILFAHEGAERNFDFWMLNCCGWPQCGIDQWWISMLSQDVLNTRFLNTDVTMNFFEHELREWHEYFYLAHGSHRSHGSLFAAGRSQFLEHEIRRRTTDRREVITRITRILFAHGYHRSHGSLFAEGRSQFFEHEYFGGTRISLTLQLSFYLLQESLGDVAGGDGT